jgi:hypothetical protein
MLLWGWLAVAAVGSYMFFRGGGSKIGNDSGAINRGLASIENSKIPAAYIDKTKREFQFYMTSPNITPMELLEAASNLAKYGAIEAAQIMQARATQLAKEIRG